jgi:integrase
MKEKLTNRLISGLKGEDKAYEVHDTIVVGLYIRVMPTGFMSYVVRWKRARKKALGRVGFLTLDQARQEATQYLHEARKHGEPLALTQNRKGNALPSLRDFIDETYMPWFKTHHKGYEKTLHTLDNNFDTIMAQRIDAITGRDLDQIRTTWMQAGNKSSTVNRKMGSISGVFSRAVEWEYITAHPMAKVKQLKVDSAGVVRYLSEDEDKRLRAAMDARQDEMRSERESANKRRAERNKVQMPSLLDVEFTDHLKPMVLISLNTGLRRGELLSLKWSSVNFSEQYITVTGDTTKTSESRHISMNTELISVLKEWKKQSGEGVYVFQKPNGTRFKDADSAWLKLLERAKIIRFRWHDMRHDFASKMVIAGASLNTVRALLGHSDIKMTLRYAHLDRGTKAAAVELLSKPRTRHL